MPSCWYSTLFILQRQLMLASPILALGLPTLVLLNMADVMAARGGKVDSLALAQELRCPVALISAAHGTNIDTISAFLQRAEEPAVCARECAHRHPARFAETRSPAANGQRWSAKPPATSSLRLRSGRSGSTRFCCNRVWGPLVFLLVVVGVFQVVFGIGQPLNDGLGEILTSAGAHVANLLPDNWLRLLLRDGLWNGVQAVLVFLPQILLLFLFIGILEDSGYLARAALIADRLMRSIGLNGKAFIPLLSAYACAVPAIMATRTIENRRDRLATILVAPFMTCSARLPIYTLIIAAFIPNKHVIGSVIGLRACVMLGLYVLGFLAALGTARLLKSSVLKASSAPFILELPQYRWPTFHSLGLRLYDRGMLFLKKAGTIILGVTFFLWILSIIPIHGGNFSDLADSVVGRLGHFIEPIIHPLGFNWKIGIGLLSSIVAREVIVGTLGTLYGADPLTHSEGLQAALRHDMTLGGAIALVVFFAFAMQCTSTLAVVRRETNSWKWPLVQFCYMSGLAYLAALVTNQLFLHFF